MSPLKTSEERDVMELESRKRYHWSIKERVVMNWRGERELSLLRFENNPDGRETRWLLFNDDRICNGSEKEMRGRCGIK